MTKENKFAATFGILWGLSWIWLTYLFDIVGLIPETTMPKWFVLFFLVLLPALTLFGMGVKFKSGLVVAKTFGIAVATFIISMTLFLFNGFVLGIGL